MSGSGEEQEETIRPEFDRSIMIDFQDPGSGIHQFTLDCTQNPETLVHLSQQKTPGSPDASTTILAITIESLQQRVDYH